MKKRTLQLSVFIACIVLLATNSAKAQWIKVGPNPGPGFNVYGMAIMGSDLYAGGIGMAKWDGTAWTDMGHVAPSYSAGLGYIGINTLAVYHGDLYVGGDIDSVGGVYIDHTIGVTKWNGTTWERLGTSAADLGGVKYMTVYHDELYACGTGGINKWNGTAWTNVATNSATCMAVYHDELYIGGNFSSMGGATMTTGLGFAKYNGTSFTALTGFYDTLAAVPGINFASVAAMIVYKDELYAIGALDYAGSLFTRGAARWNGTTWNTTNGGLTGNGSLLVNCLSIDSNNLYIVGPIQKVNSTDDSVYLSAYWDGTKWNHMFGGNAYYTSFGATVNYNGEIYTSYNGFAKWTGTSAVPALEHVSTALNVYPNPSNGIIHLALNPDEAVSIKIRNVLGVAVYQEAITHTATDHTINLGNLPEGLYFAEVSGLSGTVTTKILLRK